MTNCGFAVYRSTIFSVIILVRPHTQASTFLSQHHWGAWGIGIGGFWESGLGGGGGVGHSCGYIENYPC